MNPVVTALAQQSRQDGPGLQPASQDIWDAKYRLKTKDGRAIDGSIDDTWKRVARALADIELPEQREYWYEQFLWALYRGAIPAGRIISNAGATAYKPATSTINCTVSGRIGDSMDDILGKLHEAGLTLKAGCGIGYEFSTLRPRGAYVSGAGAYTSGPLSFMDIYDKMCFTVSSAGGRRGAQMATFDVGHPDVLEFIRAKREDGRLRQFNLSLLITREFMQAVQDDADWALAFPVTPAERETDRLDLEDDSQVLWRYWPAAGGYVQREDGKVACRIYRTLKARRIWDMIMASTYDFAEPGFILIDHVNEFNNNWFCEDIRATNPCVTADTWVQTRQGPRQVADLLDRPFVAMVDGQPHASGPEGFFRTASKPVLRLQTREGYSLRLTRDHRVRKVVHKSRWRIETRWCEAGQLQAGDQVLLNNHRAGNSWQGQGTREEGFLLGLLVGEGVLGQETAVLSIWPQQAVANGAGEGINALMDEALRCVSSLEHRADFSGWSAVTGCNEYRLKSAALRDLAFALDMRPGQKYISARLEQQSSEFYRGFLRGLFDADGLVQGNGHKGGSVRLAHADLLLLEAVQRMLLRLGIKSSLCPESCGTGGRQLPAGGEQHLCPNGTGHELIVAGDNLQEFASLVGFADAGKALHLRQLLGGYRRHLERERFVATVAGLDEDGFEDVYDVQIPGINTFDANGLHAHNCGEQPLPPYGACLLGSVNLTRFVREPFTEHAHFDWDEYRTVVRIFTRMLDNVVEINGLPLAEQRQEIFRKRRHGMGFLGLGSTLCMLRMRYGEAASLEFTERVAREMALEGWRAGLELGREKGCAPIMDEEFRVTGEMLARRPQMREDGYQEGQLVRGRVLWARYSKYMQRVAGVDPELVEALAEEGARFTHHSSIAPTGTISLSLANNASNGIEPSFAHHYFRNIIREGKKTKDKVDVFSYELLAYRALVDADADPENLPDYFISADEVTPIEHVDVQAAAQRWIDSSISKTANVPTDYPYEQFKDIYLYAWQQGLKGCTTFRFNPEAFQGVLVKGEDLAKTRYRFKLADGSRVEVQGDEQVEYDGELHTAANLYEALKEGYYGKF